MDYKNIIGKYPDELIKILYVEDLVNLGNASLREDNKAPRI